MTDLLPGRTAWETDQYNQDHGMHARLAQSLRDAAAYIETHPGLPIPTAVDIHYCIPASNDEDGTSETRRIAGILGAQVTGDDITQTRIGFGPVQYSATYITRDTKAAYTAHMTPYYAARRAARQEGPVAA